MAGTLPRRNDCALCRMSRMGRACASATLVGACVGNIETDTRGDLWMSLIGKELKAGKVALPPRARTALSL